MVVADTKIAPVLVFALGFLLYENEEKL